MNADALRRAASGLHPDVLEGLARLPGADLTTVLLELFRRRAAGIDASSVLRRYVASRFVGPAHIEARTLHRIEGAALSNLPPEVEPVVLAPVVPLGTHGIGGIAQTRVLATVRSSEVAADPTNGLALEAAVRRRALLLSDPRSAEPVKLAASQRVLRAQRFDEGASAHFQIFGRVTAGRDCGDDSFESDAFVEHVEFLAQVAVTLNPRASVFVEFTDLTGGDMWKLRTALDDALGEANRATLRDRPDRPGGRNYYERACFKVFATIDGGEPMELADGGSVGWTRDLLQNQKERLVISGLGLERLALLLDGATLDEGDEIP